MGEQGELFGNVKSIDTSKGTKKCIRCKEEKGIESFEKGWLRKDGTHKRQNLCSKCRRKNTRTLLELRLTSPAVPEDYSCPICLTKTAGHPKNDNCNWTMDAWVLDHNHDTGKFRGWLCARCNSALGWLRDDIENVRRALKYLEENKESV
jgi:hypothetical protein